MKTITVTISDELAATIEAEGLELTGEFRAPKKGELCISHRSDIHESAMTFDPSQARLILRKLPEPQQAEPVYSVSFWMDGNIVAHKVNAGGPAQAVDVILKRWGDETKIVSVILLDLVPAPKESEPVVSEPLLEFWFNEYADGVRTFHPSREIADSYNNGHRTRCVHVREVVEPSEQGGEG